ncbi:MAG: hypothetical protein VR72_00655 [Clostridiaceae bacterium BRH_c20a]|nr:MAG: hypothetical protein VR72_00655 [Clostridiaceae bacterium BRH_c20a]
MFKRNTMLMLLTLGLIALMIFSVGCGAKDPAPAPAPSPEPAKEEKPAWPQQDIEVVYHSKAGSGGDIFLRAMGKAVEPALGKAFVVNNLPGAAGATAWTRVAKAKPDGHTILGISSTLVTAPLINKMPVNFMSFEPVAMMFIDPMVIFVPADSPYKTLADIVDAAKKNPGKQKWAGGTPGELGVVAGRELMKAADFKVSLVPFEGGGDAAVSVLGGHLDAGIGEYAEIASSVEAGQLRIIVAFNKMPLNQEIPTVAEEGYPEVDVRKLRGIVATKGTPPEIIDRLVEVMKTAYDDPSFKQYYESNNLIPEFVVKDDFLKVMEEQHEQIKASLEN